MVEHTVKLQKQRDRKERDIASTEYSLKSCKETVHHYEADYEKKLKEYQVWKKENNIEGILY